MARFDWDHGGSFAHPLLYCILLLRATHGQCRSLVQSSSYSLGLTTDVIMATAGPATAETSLQQDLAQVGEGGSFITLPQ